MVGTGSAGTAGTAGTDVASASFSSGSGANDIFATSVTDSGEGEATATLSGPTSTFDIGDSSETSSSTVVPEAGAGATFGAVSNSMLALVALAAAVLLF